MAGPAVSNVQLRAPLLMEPWSQTFSDPLSGDTAWKWNEGWLTMTHSQKGELCDALPAANDH